MATQAAEGQKALEAKEYNRAVELFSKALTTSPNSPVWLIQLSIAHLRNKQHVDALLVAERAIPAAIARGKRELIATAQMRRAIALHSLKLFGDARLCFTWVRKLHEKESGLGMWQEKVKLDYDNLPENDPRRDVSIKETPNNAETLANLRKYGIALDEKNSIPIATKADVQVGQAATSSTKSAAAVLSAGPSAAPTSTQTAKDKIRQEWFQSSDKITLTFFAKNVPKEKVEVQYEPSSIYVNFPTASQGTDYQFTADPLFSEINVSKSSHNITPNKIEISLFKAMPGLKWSKLEGEAKTISESPSISQSTISPSLATQNQTSKITEQFPAYPTSSRNGPKDWDALAKDALKAERAKTVGSGSEKSKQPETLNEPDAGNESDDSNEGADKFFKMLYKGANDDTRRAMMKSFQESNGTVLSTNWAEVGKGTVETSPPDGVEARKWES